MREQAAVSEGAHTSFWVLAKMDVWTGILRNSPLVIFRPCCYSLLDPEKTQDMVIGWGHLG